LNVVSDPEDHSQVTSQKRRLGLIVVRGTQVSLLSPQDGVEEIANPFVEAEDIVDDAAASAAGHDNEQE
jgi:hypothetical protein